MRIAIVGSGIAGLSAAWCLAKSHAITLFEASPRLGGHSHTVEVDAGDRQLAVDTGFIVYNEHTYPLLTRTLAQLEVASLPSAMSFAASIGDGRLEYCGSSLGALMAQPRNAMRPSFLRMLADITRFNAAGLAYLRANPVERLTLRTFLDRGHYGRGLRDWYLLPMAAAIWSAPIARVLDLPVISFLRFFANHNLLTISSHYAWRTVVGGSRSYVERMTMPFRHRVRLASRVVRVHRRPQGVELTVAGGETRHFDQVVLACHADTSLELLTDTAPIERSLLGSFSYQENRAVLHSDPALMPRRRRAWAAWNYMAPWRADGEAGVAVTYWMNRLQGLPPEVPLFVSLNPLREPTRGTLIRDMTYAHPVFDETAIAAQARLPMLQGRRGVWFAGAWTGFGFHEDGLRSGLAVARALGCPPPWELDAHAPMSSGLGLPERAAAQPA